MQKELMPMLNLESSYALNQSSKESMLIIIVWRDSGVGPLQSNKSGSKRWSGRRLSCEIGR